MIAQIWQWLIAPEQWSGSRGIPTRLLEHLGFSALSLLLAAAIAIPVGLWAVSYTHLDVYKRQLQYRTIGSAPEVVDLSLIHI